MNLNYKSYIFFIKIIFFYQKMQLKKNRFFLFFYFFKSQNLCKKFLKMFLLRLNFRDFLIKFKINWYFNKIL